MKPYCLTAWLVVIFWAAGCAQLAPHSDGREPLALETLDAGVYGPGMDPQASAQWVTSLDHLRAVAAKLNKHRLPDETALFTTIDMDRYRVLWIQMGLKTTGGYAVSLDPTCSHVANQTAFICLNWRTPPVDAILAQVMTSPYILLKLDRAGYQTVVVTDQERQSLFEIDVPE